MVTGNASLTGKFLLDEYIQQSRFYFKRAPIDQLRESRVIYKTSVVQFSVCIEFIFISSYYSVFVVVHDTILSQAVITANVSCTDLIHLLYQNITKLHQNMSGPVLGVCILSI